jgi:hypothetical protein
VDTLLLGEGLQNPTLYVISNANFDMLPKLYKPANRGFFSIEASVLFMEQFEAEFNALFDGGNSIEHSTHMAILRFTTLFSFFEAKICDFEGKQGLSEEYATTLLAHGFDDIECLDRVYSYCQNRYLQDNEVTGDFLSLCGCEQWRQRRATSARLQAAVTSTLKLAEPQTDQKMMVCLFFCFRLRNNLFHGPKCNHNINYQVGNLHQASDLIYSILRATKGTLWNLIE